MNPDMSVTPTETCFADRLIVSISGGLLVSPLLGRR